MSNCADCGAGSCSSSGSDTECEDQCTDNYPQGYNCNYNHGSHWDIFFDYGPNYSFSPWSSYERAPKYKASPWKVNYSPYYQPTGFDPARAHASSRVHDSYSNQDQSRFYDSNRKCQPNDERMQPFGPTPFLEEHHVVHGNSRCNGPYTHENYRIDNEDGSYHGRYLWDAYRPNLGRHIHSGSYGMDRNSLQDVYYEDEAEYNLDEPSRRSESTRSTQPRSGKKKSSKKSSKRREKKESTKTVPVGNGWNEEDWRNEYHHVRGDGVAVYREESRTDGMTLAMAWMEIDRQRESSSWGDWGRW